ncbi:MAG TPA: PAS domain S-box protein, partial [Stellaceae bacterium]|nr:PAS domain S-box protein [Stellaceae bacterium]
LRARKQEPRLGDLLIAGVATVLGILTTVAWLWGLEQFEAGFASIGPAWVVLSVFTIVVLGSIIRHVERSDALARAVDENERRFRGFYNESPVMLTAVDEEERIVAASDRWLEVLGYRREEVLGKSRYEFLAPGSVAQMRERVVPALREGRKLGAVEVQLKRRDGRLVDVSATSVLRRDPVTGGEEILNFAIDQTARREVERALAERENQLRAIVDNAPVGIFLKDRESRYRLVNGRFEQWTGGAASKVLGRSDSDFLPGEESRAIRAADLKVLEEGAVYQTERKPVLPETPDQHLLVTKFPIRGADGAITGIAGFAVDITERKRAETALAERERDLRAIMDNAPFAIFFKDRGGRYRMVNRCYTQWFGRTQQDMEGRTSAELYSAPIAAMSARADAEVHVGRVVVQERPRASERTTIGHVQITQFPIRDESGGIVGSAGFCADITERNRVETALRESQELLVEAQKIGRVGHILIDRVAKRVRWSDSVFEMRGIPWRESFSFEEAITFLHPDDRPVYQAARDAAIAECRDFELDLRVLRGDGTICWEHSVGHPRFDAAGKCTGVLVVLRDISKERQAEQELRESRELLIQSQRLGKIGHLVSDRRSNRVYWSDTLFELRGVPKRDHFTLEETDTTPYIHPEDGPRFLAVRNTGIAERRDFSVDIRVQRPGGHYAWESVRGRPRFGQDGTLESVLYVLQDITERKEADEALRRKEAELRAIMDNAPLAIFLKDREGRYRLVNRCYGEWMLGGPRPVHGLTSDEIFPPQVAREMIARDREVLERGTISTAEIPAGYFDPKHGIRHAVVTKFPVRDDTGAIVGIAGFTMDITDRKRAELELRESRELLLESQRIGKIGYSVFDIAAGRVRWSDTLFEMRRQPRRDSFTPEEARAFMLPEDRAEYIRRRDEALRERRDFEYDARIRLDDGGIAWEHGIGHLRYDAEGNCASILFVVQDVTEAKVAAEALKRKEAELRAIMDNAPFAIFLKDRGGRYRLVNSAFTDWFGDRAEDMIGRTAAECYPADQAARWE